MTSFAIENSFDTLKAQGLIRQFAANLGFGRRACIELAIVASELSSNILKYAKRGRLELVDLSDPQAGRGIAVKAYDSGLPFRNINLAILDGCSDAGPIDPAEMGTRKGTGSGLGAVVRLTHAFRVETTPTGKCVIAVRYVNRPLAPLR